MKEGQSIDDAKSNLRPTTDAKSKLYPENHARRKVKRSKVEKEKEHGGSPIDY
jgi:hypothetical protein